jgi:RNA polymerase sigma-70 factor (ECF subfamily)
MIETLVEEAKRNPSAFKQLYPRFVNQIYAYVAYKVGGKQDTEDLVSETFLRALEKIKTFEYRGEGSFKAWLFQIARYVVMEHYRGQSSTVDIDDVPLIRHERFEDHIILKERFMLVQKHLRKLPARQREVILLKYFGGLRNQEIAELLKLNERTVSSYLSRGLDTLQILLEDVEVHS